MLWTGPCSRRNPTGPNTARIARCGCAGRKRPNGSRKDTCKGVIGREDMEKAFPPMLSDFIFIVVVGFGLVERCLLSFKIACALAPYI